MHVDITANYHGGNHYSNSAHKKIISKTATIRRQILQMIARSKGMTCDEIEVITGMKHQTVSARISELKRDNKIYSVAKRSTRSGCSATVYRANVQGTQTTLF